MSALRRDERVLWRRSGERFVLCCPAADEPVILEGSARLLWHLLAEPVAEEEVVQTLRDCFPDDAADLDPQVRAFLSELRLLEAVRPN